MLLGFRFGRANQLYDIVKARTFELIQAMLPDQKSVTFPFERGALVRAYSVRWERVFVVQFQYLRLRNADITTAALNMMDETDLMTRHKTR